LADLGYEMHAAPPRQLNELTDGRWTRVENVQRADVVEAGH
jgi:hypothetical protein